MYDFTKYFAPKDIVHHVLLPRRVIRGRVIGVSVGCLCVCGHKNEQFELNRAVYEL